MAIEAEKLNQPSRARRVLDTLRDPVIMIDSANFITFANLQAEYFFSSSISQISKQLLDDYIAFSSPLLALIEQVREENAPINEYRVDLSSPRLGSNRLVDIHVTPVNEEPGAMVIVFRERSMAEKLDRQMTHRGAARSVTGLASMLGHEIKNPLSGIRGAAQLLESVVGTDDRALAQLICQESDRIVQLVDKMDVFSDERPIDLNSVNIHVVLERVEKIAKNGFGANVNFTREFDPSLPFVAGNQDQLIQVFLNLVKNACESVAKLERPQVKLKTAYRPGVRLSIPGVNERVALPLEFSVEDNGNGIPEEIQNYMFDPFITTKTNGSGLGLALVAKIVGDHGGIIECDSQMGKTVFRILMPAASKEMNNELAEGNNTP